MKLSMDEMARIYRKTVENPSSEPNVLIDHIAEQSLCGMLLYPNIMHLLVNMTRIFQQRIFGKILKNESEHQHLSQLVIDFAEEVTAHI